MTRAEAIDHIFGLSLQVDGEFCVGARESDQLHQETRDALRALGVDDEEMS